MGSQNRKKKLALRAKKTLTAKHKANREYKLKQPAIIREGMQSFMENFVPDCIECGSERKRVEVEQIPADKLRFWESKPEFNSYRYFIHCPHCGTFNPMGEVMGSRET